ncbi:MAG: zinc-dependent alcohol dehydrogenase family protein [Chloroflexales bacterium]|nr:zinc-dependent alcohol dehydrogenase family protein [Chloroflexales bacterium]
MRAVIFTAPETVVVTDVPEPACGPDEVVIQVARAGLCGTDLHIYRNEYLSNFPLIPGHEFTGVVVAIGAAVTNLRMGERVAADPNLACGQCVFCQQMQFNHCLNWQGVGITRPGAFAEYVAVPARACYRLPDDLTDAQAAFIEPLSCVVHALNRMRVWPGDDALIFGAGPMGLLLVQALCHSGAARVVVVDKQPDRLTLAGQMGALTVAAGPEQHATLQELAPHGFAIVVDATGVPAVIAQALSYLRPRGQYLQFGVAPRDATVQWRPFDLFRYDWTIIGSFALCYTFQPAIAWLTGGIIDIEALVSHTLPLADFPMTLQLFAEGKTLKVQFTPQ